ncbi:MAG: hypothetical protein LBS05_01160 [Tannerellaceae bacterium]|jgi:hypothetical protein|nr:hypothetical protein [Tannerellaceae bacterium]
MSAVQVTSTEFRSKQAYFFDLADKGVKVIIHRGKRRIYRLSSVDEEEYSLSLSEDNDTTINNHRR